ncbi:hypothetical protein GZ77_15740 [Endozoicomonas montiporae]|uniref:Uncharacterized protein n=2 Tax=Endozoicomonas montiporae TaxID=1027273 RepID=A0A081N5M1_9GAMM|nr:hypothetical protein [Endozoicomonas montiporae]AMO57359.1 hypothetical protein EZMO1_3368 [Endozoicomonas montiporae CL-33]KEQ13744.1 hypothetical protein GZ77_15740 [Endozoicomonas montiporae]
MSYLKLKLVTTGSLGNLERVLHSDVDYELKINHFSAEHNTDRNCYEVEMCISGFQTQDQIIMKLAGEKEIRELTPLRR